MEVENKTNIVPQNFSVTDAGLYGLRKLSQGEGLFLKLIVPFALILFLGAFLQNLWTEPYRDVQVENFMSLLEGKMSAVEIEQQNQILAQQGGQSLLSSFVLLVLNILVYAASLRWLIRGETQGSAGPFRLGSDELRLFGVMLLYAVAVIVIALALIIPFGGIFFLMKSMIMEGDKDSGMLGMFVLNLILIPLFIIGLVWSYTRFSLASALTVAENRFQFFKSWKLTQHIVWKLISSYIMVGFLLVFVFTMPFMLVMFLLPEGSVKTILTPLFSSVSGIISVLSFSGIQAYALRFLGIQVQTTDV